MDTGIHRLESSTLDVCFQSLNEKKCRECAQGLEVACFSAPKWPRIVALPCVPSFPIGHPHMSLKGLACSFFPTCNKDCTHAELLASISCICRNVLCLRCATLCMCCAGNTCKIACVNALAKRPTGVNVGLQIGQKNCISIPGGLDSRLEKCIFEPCVGPKVTNLHALLGHPKRSMLF